jgi:hypothetical protein
MREALLLQAFLEQFPAKPIRENNLKSRESTAESWELRKRPCKRPFLAPLFDR